MNRKYLIVIFILVGFTSTVVQTVLLRELVTIFAGNEFSLGIFFASWFVSVALGSWMFGKLPHRLNDYHGITETKEKYWKWLNLFLVLQVIAVSILPLQILIIRGARSFLGIQPGQIIPPFPIFYYPVLSLMPFAFVHGFQFALGCKIYSDFETDPAGAIGKVYFFDAIGDMFGGFAAGYFFIAFFHSFQTWIFLLVSSLLLFLIFSFKKGLLKTTVCLIVSLCIIVMNLFNGNLDRLKASSLRLGWKGFNLVDVKSSKYGDIAVVKKGNLASVYENGVLSFTNPDRFHSEEIVHLPMLEVPEPRNILILGDALSGPLMEILKYSPRRIDYVELDKAFIDVSSRHITKEDNYALFSPTVKIHNSDGRAFVKTWRGGPFDCMIVNTGKSTTAVANRFYTLDFFREAAGILKENGILSLGVDSNENYVGPELRNFNGCIYNTVEKVFPYIVLVPGETLYIIASRNPSFLTSNPFLLVQRLKSRGIKTQFLNEYTLPYYFQPDRIDYVRSAIKEVNKERLNRDFHPVSYYFNLILWGTKFRSGIAPVFWRVSGIRFWWLLVGIAVAVSIFKLLKKNRQSAISLAIANAGFTGISLEIILIIGFQVLYGYLYHLVGIIIAAFMLGLAIGIAYITPRLAEIKDETKNLAMWQMGLGIYSIALACLLYLFSFCPAGIISQINIKIIFPLLTLIDGFFVGLMFPVASRGYVKLTGKGPGESGGMLYASDLIGACIGSVFVSVFLVPLYGIFSTLVLIGSLNFATAIILKMPGKKLHKI